MRLPRVWCWSVLALCAAGCASGRGAARGSATENRARELEARNAELRAEVARQEAELRQAFSEVSQAEAAAGLGSLGCVGVSPASAPVPGLPQSGAVYARFQLRGQPYRMTATFSAPRTAGAWRLSQGTCKVGP